MIEITTTAKAVTIEKPDFKWIIVKSRVKGQIPFASGTRLVTEMGEITLPYNEVTGNGDAFGSAEDLQNWIESNCFSVGGGTGEGVQSIVEGTGITVDNTDPGNPIVSSDFANPTWDSVDEKPQYMAVGDTAAQARSAIGLGSAATRPAGDFDESGAAAAAELAAKEYTDQKVAGVYVFKGSVDDFASLPTDGVIAGDVYNVLDTDINYAWTGTVWDPLGSTLVVTWASIDKPTFVAAGATAADARSAIGLGTSSTYPSSAYATAAQGAKADSAVQPAAIAAIVESKQEESKGALINNHLFITQADYDSLAVKNPTTAYDIVEDYPA